jgi:hypothetical protein
MKIKLAIFAQFLLINSCITNLFANDPEKNSRVSLFNGKDLSGWTSVGSAKWEVSDRIIKGGQNGNPSKSGVLWTNEIFKDFDLTLEFKIDEHGKYNSGVYFRKSKTKPLGRPYQINIGRGAAGEPIGLHIDDWLDKGDEKDEFRKPLKWNSLRILAIGPDIKTWLNGNLIVDYKDPSPRKDLLEAGMIGFQTYGAEGHAGWIHFRNISIKKIK